MTHEALRERLLDLAYGELAPREAREVEAHARSCEGCRAELARLRETRRTMSALAPEPAPEWGERILLAAAREEAERRRPRRARPPWLWSAAAVALSFVAVAAVSYRIIAMRPGPLSGGDDEALLGRSPYASRPPEPTPSAPPEAPGAPPEKHSGRELAVTAEEPAPRDLAVPAPAERPAPRAKEAPAGERFARAEDEARAPVAAARPEPRAERAPPPVSDEPAAESHAGRAPGEVYAFDAERLNPPPTLDAAPSASASAAPSRAEPGPAPAAAAAPSRSAAPSRAAAAPRAPKAAAPDAALRRYAALRDAGALHAEVRTFEGCAGEAVRRVEWDPEGRLVRYVREGRIAGRRLRVEHVYGMDGLLAAATVRDLDAPGAALDADALGLVLPARAEEAGLDAPPRCGR